MQDHPVGYERVETIYSDELGKVVEKLLRNALIS